MGLELGIGNKILSLESMDITEKSNEYLPLLKDYKANSDLNGVNGNDTFSPHSPKVVTEKWLEEIRS